jgi:hypothetical protein
MSVRFIISKLVLSWTGQRAWSVEEKGGTGRKGEGRARGEDEKENA